MKRTTGRRDPCRSMGAYDLAEMIETALSKALTEALPRYREAWREDFRAVMASRMTADPYDSGLLVAIAETGRRDWLCSDIFVLAETSESLRQALLDCDIENKTDLWVWCRRLVDRTVNGLALRRAGRAGPGMRWSIVSVV